jgi:hypothetical protein
MATPRQDIKAAWILSAAMAGSALGIFLIEMFVANPGRALQAWDFRVWGLIAMFAGLAIAGAGLAFHLMAKGSGREMEGSSIAPFAGSPDFQLMGFGAMTALLGAAVHIWQV